MQPEATAQRRVSDSDWNDPHLDNFHDASLIGIW